MGKLEGKIAIVTGSGKGIGRDAALAIAAEGATVVTVARTQSDLDKTVKMIEDAGGTAISLSSCLLYTSPSPRDSTSSRMPSSA